MSSLRDAVRLAEGIGCRVEELLAEREEMRGELMRMAVAGIEAGKGCTWCYRVVVEGIAEGVMREAEVMRMLGVMGL